MSAPVRDTSHPKSVQRVDYIDLLRGWAVIVMIETHVVNATLAEEIMSDRMFQYVRFLNGLVAPSFLFASGLAFAITARRKLPDYLSFGSPLFKQLGRLLLIAGLGYALHIPIFSLHRLLSEATDAQWQSFFQVDILQCIAVSLLMLQFLLVVLKNERLLYRFTLVLGAAIVLCTPFIWSIDFWDTVPWPAAAYLNGLRYSLFPLFPWAVFLLAGSLIGHHFSRGMTTLSALDSDAHERSMQSLLWIGGSMILLSIALEPIAGILFPEHDYWRASPSFFLLRLGLVILLCWVMHVSSRGRKTAMRPIVMLFGRESLLVYVLHLLMIYGSFGGFNFRKEVSQTFGYLEAGISACMLCLLMYAVALWWSRIKAGYPRMKTAMNMVTLALVLALFLFGEGE